jgi:galactokinase
MQHSLDLKSNFQARFEGVPKLHRASGRVNLVGEHPDCCEAYVMPAGIDFSCWAAAAPRDDSQVRHLFRKFPLREISPRPAFARFLFCYLMTFGMCFGSGRRSVSLKWI